MVTTTSRNIRRPIPDASKPEQEQISMPEFTPRDGSIIDDILRRVQEAMPNFSAEVAQKVSQEAHRDWAGDRPYISPTGGAEYKSQRDQRIYSDWQRGERIPLLMRRYQLTERRIRQIIFGK